MNSTTDPVRFFGDLTSDLNALADTFFGENGLRGEVGSVRKNTRFSPPIDIVESDNGYTIDMDLPGVAPENVDIHLEDDGLVISGSRVRAELEESSESRRRERFEGEFRRVVRMPELIDRDQITADYHQGVLTVTVPKVTKPDPKKIVIRTS